MEEEYHRGEEMYEKSTTKGKRKDFIFPGIKATKSNTMWEGKLGQRKIGS